MRQASLAIACVALSVVTLPAALQETAQTPDAQSLLAAARQALGGDAALSAVSSFTVSGSHTRDLGPVSSSSSVEIACVLPDKFLRTLRRLTSMGPMGSFEITQRDGLSGAETIHETIAPDAPFPVTFQGPPPTTPEGIALAKQRRHDASRRIFVQLLLPMFAASFEASPLQFVATGRVALPDALVDVLEVRGPNDLRWTLFLDAATHRPIRLTWMANPNTVASTSSMVTMTTTTTGRGQVVSPPRVTPGPPPSFPPGDPTAGLVPVEWQMVIGDYRVADGLTWPHRLTTSIAGKRYEDLRLGRFRINPKIDLRMFTSR